MEQLKSYITQSLPIHNYSMNFCKVDLHDQSSLASLIKTNHGVLLTEWIYAETTGHFIWSVLYLIQSDLYCLQSELNFKSPYIMDLSHTYPVSNRLHRTIYELYAIPTVHSNDTRPWLNHGHFPIGILNQPFNQTQEHYSFIKVSGQGVHEIPVGPVHAGIIEPGHFRFSVVGERILKLEERLGYTHKGIHKLLMNASLEKAHQLMGRISGDSTVAYAYAFAKACEQVKGVTPHPSIQLERNICLERERLSNHIGDIGAIINDCAMPSLQSSFTILKEQLLRKNYEYSGHRYLMDCIKPFNSERLFTQKQFNNMDDELNLIQDSLTSLKKIVDNHFGLQDRLCTTGIITPEQAQYLGLLGLASKASNIDNDLRRLIENNNIITPCIDQQGDVAARVNVRFKECFESIQLIMDYSRQIELNSFLNETQTQTINPIGFGLVEGWRGPITVIVYLKDNHVSWCHFHDPSWQNWLALEYAVHNNIVADFPLINKSFNLSYSGHDS